MYADAPASVQPVAGDVPGAVLVDAGRQQLIGLSTAEVKRVPVSSLLRLPGRIAVDPDRLYRIIAASDGWIRNLGPNPPGTFVKKDQVLASYYAPNFQAAQQTLLFALENGDQLLRRDVQIGAQRPKVASNLQIAIDTMRSLGMSDPQIEEIRRTRAYASEIQVYSPTAGFVIERTISPEQRFDKGAELYRIADLSRVWVLTDLFERDRDVAKPGMIATVRYQGQEFRARISGALPQFDPQSRTLKTRLELDNPGYLLRPDMFVDVELNVEREAAIRIPAEAVIDTGLRKIVFVESGAGWFAPRQVQTGWRLGDDVEITSGLEPGDRIVTSGAFLIDSESRMRIAGAAKNEPQIQKTSAAAGVQVAIDPVCGMEVKKDADAIKTEYRGKTYWFCSKSCREDFEAAPQKHLSGSAAAPRSVHAGPA